MAHNSEISGRISVTWNQYRQIIIVHTAKGDLMTTYLSFQSFVRSMTLSEFWFMIHEVSFFEESCLILLFSVFHNQGFGPVVILRC